MFLSFFFFFKQKTAYEMRISDWSSDVCSSDLVSASHQGAEHGDRRVGKRGFHLAQRSKQDDPPAGGAHLLEGLGGIAHAFAGELRHAWLVQGIDRNTGNSGPADQS